MRTGGWWKWLNEMLKTAIIETILQLNLESHHDESLVVVIG
ncbi:Uncharacterised protein [Enterobacter hormaechei]|nr:Uncharacterised protein [Enterobacter hormaechei]